MLESLILLAAEVVEAIRKSQAGEPLTAKEMDLAAINRKDDVAEMVEAVKNAPEA